MHGTQEEINDRVVEAVSVILDALNGGNQRQISEVVLRRLTKEHRTIQQSFWSMMLLTQIEYAGANFDLRNEMAVRLANKVKEVAVKNNFDLGLPNI